MKIEDDFLVTTPSGLNEQVADSFVFRLPDVPSTVTIRRPNGAGVCWDTLQKDELVLFEVAGALAELEILYGDPVEVTTEGEGNVPRAALAEIRRALNDWPPSPAEMLVADALGEPTFIRFLPPSLYGTSMDRRTGEIHAGVSVFPGRPLNEALYEIDVTQVGGNTVEILEICLQCAAPAFFLAGPVVGLGPGNEPLLHVERFWPVPRSVDLTVTPVSSPAMNRQLATLAKRWNESPYVGKLVKEAIRKASYSHTTYAQALWDVWGCTLTEASLKPLTVSPNSFKVPTVSPNSFKVPTGVEIDRLAAKLLAEWRRA